MIYSLKELAELNDKMLSRGAPVQYDGIGYNKPDYAVCCHYFGIPSYSMAYDIANRLIKYTETQKIADKESLQETALKYYSMAAKDIDKITDYNKNLDSFEHRMKYTDVSVSIVDKNPHILFNVNSFNPKAQEIIKRTRMERVIIQDKDVKHYLYKDELVYAMSILRMFAAEGFDVTSAVQYLVAIYGAEHFKDKPFDEHTIVIDVTSLGPFVSLKFQFNNDLRNLIKTMNGRWNAQSVAWEIAKSDYNLLKEKAEVLGKQRGFQVKFIEDENTMKFTQAQDKVAYTYVARDIDIGRSHGTIIVTVSYTDYTYLKAVIAPLKMCNSIYDGENKEWTVYKTEIPQIIQRAKEDSEKSMEYFIDTTALEPYLNDLKYIPDSQTGLGSEYEYRLKQYIEVTKIEPEKVFVRLGKEYDVNDTFVTIVSKSCDFIDVTDPETGEGVVSRKNIIKFNNFIRNTTCNRYVHSIRGCFYVDELLDPSLQRDDIKDKGVIIHMLQDLGRTLVFSVSDERLRSLLNSFSYRYQLKVKDGLYVISIVDFPQLRSYMEREGKYHLKNGERIEFLFDFELDTLLDSPFVYDASNVSVMIGQARVTGDLLGRGDFSFLSTEPRVIQESAFEHPENPFSFRVTQYPLSKVPEFIRALETRIEKDPKPEYKVLLQALQDIEIKKRTVDSYNITDFIDCKSLSPAPWEFQIDGANRIINEKGVILGDPMGLGKTKTAVIASSVIDAIKIIVCPKTLMLKWRREIKIINPAAKVHIVLDNNVGAVQLRKYEYIIINYERFVIVQEIFYQLRELEKNNIALFMDEAHKLGGIKKDGSPTAQWTVALLEFAKPLEYVVPITGTPIRDKAKTFFNLLRIIGAEDLSFSAKWYLEKWGFDKISPHHSSLGELSEKSKKYIIRHTDVKNSITKKLRDFIPVQLGPEGQRMYQEWLDEYAMNHDISYALVRYNALKQALAYMKYKFTIDLVDDLIEQDKTVAIFTHYVDLAEKFADHFKKHGHKVGLITNKTKTEERDSIETALNNNELNVVCATMGVGGEGLDFLGADVEVINDLGWKITELIQTEDRLDRMNRKDFFNIIYTYAEDVEIEQYLYDLVYSKIGVIERILDEQSNDNSLSNAITEFLNEKVHGVTSSKGKQMVMDIEE